ncbi:DUF934 domain-containing protein [Ralstonia soli]|uniref:DUF934 domain-containing protein n=1 Tax=Ralstonia soli TaxID=2953896 RepID=A0ABT1ALZ5_9RALS|nr:DUF934 domain-containing protein [Ralstonia soli]MCO5399122.1 DUF934 domain-containing protein [Ralstonia soli]
MNRIKLLTEEQHLGEARDGIVTLANDVDPMEVQALISAARCVELHFPQFTDGRALSQAYLIRRRLRFEADVRAIGEILVDQLFQLERMGFSSAVLPSGIAPDAASLHLDRFPSFYQADILRAAPFA